MPKAEFFPADISDVEVFSIDERQTKTKTDSESKTDALASALADDENAFVSIHLNENGREIFVERIPADKFDYGQIQTYLKDRYGGGDFRIRLYANGKLRQNKLIEILKTREKPELTSGDQMAGVISQLIARMDRQDQALNAILQNHNNSANNEMEFLQKMQIYKSLFDNSGAHKQIDPMVQLNNTLGVLQNMGVQIGGTAGERDEPGFGDLMEKFTPLIELAMTNQANKPLPKSNPIDPKQRQYMQWKNGVSLLLNGAKSGGDAGMYAEMIINQLGAQKVRAFVGTGTNAVMQFQKLFPETVQYAAWFKMLFEHLKAQLGMPSDVDAEYADDTDGDDLTAEYNSDNDSGKSSPLSDDDA